MTQSATGSQDQQALSIARCHQARIERDPAFDGRFFFAVTTTGIYCRPVCSARRALAKNVRYFDSAASAATAGFRPCRRCRPEAAPPRSDVGHELVARALLCIDEGALDDGSVVQLAQSLDVGERRLRRLFHRELGASPKKIALTRRLLLSRQMLETTTTSVIDIAFASGFNSLRRFNEAFKAAFHASPSEVRRSQAQSSSADLALRLGVKEPHDGEGLLRFLAARAIPGVEHVRIGVAGNGQYSRSFRLGSDCGVLTVHVEGGAKPSQSSLLLEIRFSPSPDRFPNVMPLVEKVKQIFDLSFDPLWIEHFAQDDVLRTTYLQVPGIRVPGCLDPFELAVRAVLGQQVTVAGATTLSGRVAERWGKPLPNGPVRSEDGSRSEFRLFPSPDAIVDAPLEEIGLPTSRAATLRGVARAVLEHTDLFDRTQELSDFERRFCELPGIGPWTANYVAMRALHARDAFLAGDLVLRKRVAALGLGPTGKLPSAASLELLSRNWSPFRAYAGMLLWRS